MRSEILKKGLTYLPETTLMSGGILCTIADIISGSMSVLTVVGLVGVAGLLVLLKFRNKNLALIISLVSGMLSLFFILALLSEFGEFPRGSRQGLNMLGMGSFLFLGLLAVSIMLPVKYFRKAKTRVHRHAGMY